MNRKPTVPQNDRLDNGPPAGDAREPEGAADTAFDAAALEAADTRPQPSAPDPFDLESLRLPLDAGAVLGVKKLLTRVPVQKPDKTWFVRVHPDPAYRLESALLRDDQNTYFIARDLLPELVTEAAIRRCALFTGITRQGVVFLWPISLPGPDGRSNPWHETEFQAAALAEKTWLRVIPNTALGGNEVLQATAALSDPEWPELTFSELLRIASRGRIIDRLDHPILRRLRGEV
jgi:hypothetical protein